MGLETDEMICQLTKDWRCYSQYREISLVVVPRWWLCHHLRYQRPKGPQNPLSDPPKNIPETSNRPKMPRVMIILQ